MVQLLVGIGAAAQNGIDMGQLIYASLYTVDPAGLRAQARLRFASQLDLDRGWAAARDDADEVRCVDQPPGTG